MVTDSADALRDLAHALEEDALDHMPRTAHEQGVQEGLGRAVGRAKERAQELENGE